MKQIAAIRTNRWGPAEERLLEHLRQAFGDDVTVVFHNRPSGVAPPADVVDLQGAWLSEQGLRAVQDWGWRCGDYFYYALRTAKPRYDYYWLVEPDVLFSGPASDFFARFDTVGTDVLGLDPEPMPDPTAPFAGSLLHLERWRAIFALTRMSGTALDRLLDLRRENSRFEIGPRKFANDELFVFSNAMAHPDIHVGNLRDHAGDWFDGAHFDTAPDIIDRAVLDTPAMAGKVFHPVRNLEGFKAEVANRIAQRMAFMDKTGDSWAHLDDKDLVEIADDIRAQVLKNLRDGKAANARTKEAAE
ncbi:MAG: component of SufBCD complex [Pseudomonadota bacterium]